MILQCTVSQRFAGSKWLDDTFVLGSKRPREDNQGGEKPLKKMLVAGSSLSGDGSRRFNSL